MSQDCHFWDVSEFPNGMTAFIFICFNPCPKKYDHVLCAGKYSIHTSRHAYLSCWFVIFYIMFLFIAATTRKRLVAAILTL